MNISELLAVRLSEGTEVKPFACSDNDLNEFLCEEAANYTKELLAVTYIFENDIDTVVYFSLFNDSVNLKDKPSPDRNRVNRAIPNQKRINSYPAVKVGRLAVSEKYERQGIGNQVLNFVKQMFTYNNKTGCRYITVDAYAAAIPFYVKNGFRFLTADDEGDDTRLMYFDLKKFI